MRISHQASVFVVATALVTGCATQPSTDDDGDSPDTSMSEANLSSNTHTAYNFFVAKHLTKKQSAGIVGNFMQESSVNPTAKEFNGGPGRGIAQWSTGGRWDRDHHDNVTWYASEHHRSRWTLATQLDFTWYELDSVGGYGLTRLRDSTTIRSATIAFEDDFEGCGRCDESKRIAYADQVYRDYAERAASVQDAKIGCYSETIGSEVPHSACVQSAADSNWYACDDGDWVDAETAPDACSEQHALAQ